NFKFSKRAALPPRMDAGRYTAPQAAFTVLRGSGQMTLGRYGNGSVDHERFILRGDCPVKFARLVTVLALLLSANSVGRVRLASAPPAAAPSHIAYILSDDPGGKDGGFHGSDLTTPNIEQLAKGGARLEPGHAHPMCAPSRAALMPGRYPHR